MWVSWFLPLLLLFLGAGQVLAMQPHIRDLWVESRGNFSKPYRWMPDESLVELRSVLIDDVDQDGDLDIVGISNAGVFVRRGESLPGRFGPVEVQAATKGATELLRGGDSGMFWVRWENRNFVDLVSWTSNQWSIVRSEEVTANEHWAIWEGFLAHGPDNQGRLIASDGSGAHVIANDLAELDRIEVMDVEADGREDLVLTLKDHQVGWIRTVPVSVPVSDPDPVSDPVSDPDPASDLPYTAPIEWIPGISDFQGSWTFAPSDRGELRIYGHINREIWEMKQKGAGSWSREETNFPTHLLPHHEIWRFRLNSEEWLVFAHDEISHSCSIATYPASDKLRWTNASEAPAVQSLHVLDFNGDGLRDVMYLDTEEREVVFVFQLKSRSDEEALRCMDWPWEAVYPQGVEIEAAGRLPFWDGMDITHYHDLSDHVLPQQRIHSLAIRGGSIWGQVDEVSFELSRPQFHRDHEGHRGLEEKLADYGGPWISEIGEVAVAWPHVELMPDEQGWQFAYMGKIDLEQWHHFAFSRDENLRVKGYIDGKCVMKGYSEDVRFDHRRILLGATYGTRWGGFFKGRIDEVEFSNKVFSDEEVRERFEAREVVPDAWTQSWINFEPTGGGVSELISGRSIKFDGGWSFVEGVSGQAVRFDGEDGRGFVSTDLAEKNMSISYWAYIEKESDASPRRNRNQTILSAYGMFNDNHTISDVPVAQPPARELKGFDFERLSDPLGEAGRRLIWEGAEFFVSFRGAVFALNEGQWEGVKTTGAEPEAQNGVIWVERNRVHIISEEGAHHSFSFETFNWRREGSVDLSSFGMLTGVLRSEDGVAFLGRKDGAMNGWWKSRASAQLAPLHAPSSDLAEGEEWVGMESQWGFLHWVSRQGRMEPVMLNRELETVPLHAGFKGKWGAGLGLALLLLVWVWRMRPHGQAGRIQLDEATPLPDDELQRVLEKFREVAPVVLDTNGLDELLGLDDLQSGETRRSHRARLIRQCNEWTESLNGQPVVKRKKDPTDRRRTLYAIAWTLPEGTSSAGAQGFEAKE